jgi:hypothetical protein
VRARPRDYLGDQTPKERANANRQTTADWIYRFGFSSSQVLKHVLQKQGAGWPSVAAKRGLLRSTKTESGVPGVIYTLAEQGLELAERHSMTLLPYPEIDPYRVNQATIRHNLLVQAMTIKAINNGQIVRVTTEKELNAGDQRGQKRPDAIWHFPDGQRIGIEMELSAKWDRKLDEFISGIAASLDSEVPEDRLDGFAIITDSEAICRRYREAMKPGEPLRYWRKNARHQWEVESHDKVPAWLQDHVEVRMVAM